MPEIHVSSLVIQHIAGHDAALMAAVSAMDGVEWHAAQNGKAVVTVVTETEAQVLDRVDSINALPGVLTTTLVYHHYEEAEAGAAPLAQ